LVWCSWKKETKFTLVIDFNDGGLDVALVAHYRSSGKCTAFRRARVQMIDEHSYLLSGRIHDSWALEVQSTAGLGVAQMQVHGIHEAMFGSEDVVATIVEHRLAELEAKVGKDRRVYATDKLSTTQLRLACEEKVAELLSQPAGKSKASIKRSTTSSSSSGTNAGTSGGTCGTIDDADGAAVKSGAGGTIGVTDIEYQADFGDGWVGSADAKNSPTAVTPKAVLDGLRSSINLAGVEAISKGMVMRAMAVVRGCFKKDEEEAKAQEEEPAGAKRSSNAFGSTDKKPARKLPDKADVDHVILIGDCARLPDFVEGVIALFGEEKIHKQWVLPPRRGQWAKKTAESISGSSAMNVVALSEEESEQELAEEEERRRAAAEDQKRRESWGDQHKLLVVFGAAAQAASQGVLPELDERGMGGMEGGYQSLRDRIRRSLDEEAALVKRRRASLQMLRRTAESQAQQQLIRQRAHDVLEYALLPPEVRVVGIAPRAIGLQTLTEAGVRFGTEYVVGGANGGAAENTIMRTIIRQHHPLSCKKSLRVCTAMDLQRSLILRILEGPAECTPLPPSSSAVQSTRKAAQAQIQAQALSLGGDGVAPMGHIEMDALAEDAAAEPEQNNSVATVVPPGCTLLAAFEVEGLPYKSKGVEVDITFALDGIHGIIQATASIDTIGETTPRPLPIRSLRLDAEGSEIVHAALTRGPDAARVQGALSPSTAAVQRNQRASDAQLRQRMMLLPVVAPDARPYIMGQRDSYWEAVSAMGY
jgi:hypothetical protein